jgi:DNA modification methylase
VVSLSLYKDDDMTSTLPLQPIHPFPARMAPEIALAQTKLLDAGSVVLDPMAGSGTVLRVATEHGHHAIGFDMDPLAVLMARVWTTPIDPTELRAAADEVLAQAEEINDQYVTLPWIEDDPATRKYVDLWFGPQQQPSLRKLSYVLRDVKGVIGDALRIALSRIIITKDSGASLARDVSHSRPHHMHEDNHFDVIKGFRQSVGRLAKRLEDQPPPGNANIRNGDARNLQAVTDGTINAVITSPPYLNAIDYMRGHRLSLVWLGFTLGELSPIRSNSIGAERAPNRDANIALAAQLTAPLGSLKDLPQHIQRMIDRYILDLHGMIVELHRVLCAGGKAVFVVGNSCIKNIFIRNALAVEAIAERVGFQFVRRDERELPPSRRYLPPPTQQEGSNLQKRMRTETVLTYQRR